MATIAELQSQASNYYNSLSAAEQASPTVWESNPVLSSLHNQVLALQNAAGNVYNSATGTYSPAATTNTATTGYTPYYGTYNNQESLASWGKNNGIEVYYNPTENKTYVGGVAFNPESVPGMTNIAGHNYVTNTAALQSALAAAKGATGAKTAAGTNLGTTIAKMLSSIAAGPAAPNYVEMPKAGKISDYLSQATELTKEETKAANLAIIAQYAEAGSLIPYGLNAKGLNHGGVLRGAYAGLDQKRAMALDAAKAAALAKNVELATGMRSQEYQQNLAAAQATNAQVLNQYNAEINRYNTVLNGLLSMYSTNAGITQSGLELYGSGSVGEYSINELLNSTLSSLGV